MKRKLKHKIFGKWEDWKWSKEDLFFILWGYVGSIIGLIGIYFWEWR